MRASLKLLLRSCLIALGLLAVVMVAWFRYYTRDLPDINAISQFAPTAITSSPANCDRGSITAIPYDEIGRNLRDALTAAEGGDDSSGALGQTWQALTDVRGIRVAKSLQIARMMFCTPAKALTRNIQELRLADHLERRFSGRQLFTIAANRYDFGSGVTGVYDASQRFFHKSPKDLSVPEAALLAALVRAPGYFSPRAHPDRAELRRNVILEQMAVSRFITQAEADAAKRAPLGINPY